jgi:hypothetical protein
MNTPTVRRAPNGHLLPGSVLNPGGRPKSAIEEVRALLTPHAPQLVAKLVELAQSENEAVRLAAIREALDRLLGKPPLAVDTTVQKIDLGQLYLEAVKKVNEPPMVDATPLADEPAVITTDQW